MQKLSSTDDLITWRRQESLRTSGHKRPGTSALGAGIHQKGTSILSAEAVIYHPCRLGMGCLVLREGLSQGKKTKEQATQAAAACTWLPLYLSSPHDSSLKASKYAGTATPMILAQYALGHSEKPPLAVRTIPSSSSRCVSRYLRLLNSVPRGQKDPQPKRPPPVFFK
ncbi:hypothetical protein JRQ81_019033 [Phrynocephalus forsythii]|uniref:Uncharacterized protein n=1 Tax=Phrynocephalus forsythii TaxID=171643 RepID=A0A9Q1AZB0_9SAUR|nr:hypothetical protein JRQ81_019033 [Phrynocephalus forsythii]